MSVPCDCTAGPPWPRMRRLHVAGAGRWYLCRACGALREDVCRADGTIRETRFHTVESDGLPEMVREAVGEMMGRGEYEQLGLFE